MQIHTSASALAQCMFAFATSCCRCLGYLTTHADQGHHCRNDQESIFVMEHDVVQRVPIPTHAGAMLVKHKRSILSPKRWCLSYTVLPTLLICLHSPVPPCHDSTCSSSSGCPRLPWQRRLAVRQSRECGEIKQFAGNNFKSNKWPWNRTRRSCNLDQASSKLFTTTKVTTPFHFCLCQFWSPWNMEEPIPHSLPYKILL